MSEKKEGVTAKKAVDFDEWYAQMIIRSELADYSPVSGCLVLPPSGYAIWENIQKFVDAEFNRAGIQNAYFPLFIPERLLNKESEHIAGFAPEVAWVTEAGHSKLEERLAVRPTSETIMYEVVSRWIRSWRDLPLRLNQWNNVVRWEFKHPVPFLRGREFLWNEGHSMFASKEAADAERDEILGIYRKVTEELLALPSYVGRKTDSEKFAGAEATYSMEHLLPDGKAIQGPDFHSDGQRFSKAFEISFVDEQGDTKNVWQNTWAITTREVGVMLAVHGDDKGAVVPPLLAEVQVVVVPIVNDESKDAVLRAARLIADTLALRYRTRLDDRDHLTPGRKFNEWELKGVPLRLELGPRDLKEGHAVIVRRDTGSKRVVQASQVEEEVERDLREMQSSLLKKATDALMSSTREASSMSELVSIMKESGGIVRVEWCGRRSCEEAMGEKAGGKILNIPLDQKSAKGRCVSCGEPSTVVVNYGKSY